MTAFAGSQRYEIANQLFNSDNTSFDAAGVPVVLLYQDRTASTTRR